MPARLTKPVEVPLDRPIILLNLSMDMSSLANQSEGTW